MRFAKVFKQVVFIEFKLVVLKVIRISCYHPRYIVERYKVQITTLNTYFAQLLQVKITVKVYQRNSLHLRQILVNVT